MESDPSADTRAQLKREIAERRRVAAALEESENRYRVLVGQVKDYAIFGMDAEGRALTWNEGVEAVTLIAWPRCSRT